MKRVFFYQTYFRYKTPWNYRIYSLCILLLLCRTATEENKYPSCLLNIYFLVTRDCFVFNFMTSVFFLQSAYSDVEPEKEQRAQVMCSVCLISTWPKANNYTTSEYKVQIIALVSSIKYSSVLRGGEEEKHTKFLNLWFSSLM